MAIYYFGRPSDASYKALGDRTSSGALVLNDMMSQATCVDYGFGGVGGSGMGRVGGKIGFQSFSNPKAVCERLIQNNNWPITMLCPPWDGKENTILKIFMLKPFRQNAIAYNVCCIVLGLLSALLLFGDLGESELRRSCYRGVIDFLTPFTRKPLGY